MEELRGLKELLVTGSVRHCVKFLFMIILLDRARTVSTPCRESRAR